MIVVVAVPSATMESGFGTSVIAPVGRPDSVKVPFVDDTPGIVAPFASFKLTAVNVSALFWLAVLRIEKVTVANTPDEVLVLPVKPTKPRLTWPGILVFGAKSPGTSPITAFVAVKTVAS